MSCTVELVAAGAGAVVRARAQVRPSRPSEGLSAAHRRLSTLLDSLCQGRSGSGVCVSLAWMLLSVVKETSMLRLGAHLGAHLSGHNKICQSPLCPPLPTSELAIAPLAVSTALLPCPFSSLPPPSPHPHPPPIPQAWMGLICDADAPLFRDAVSSTSVLCEILVLRSGTCLSQCQ